MPSGVVLTGFRMFNPKSGEDVSTHFDVRSFFEKLINLEKKQGY